MIFLDTSFGTLRIDTTISETTDKTSVVTKEPVEFGADVADHVIVNPITYSMEGIVSNHQLREIKDDITRSESTEDKRDVAAWKVLSDLWRNAELFNIQTNLELIESVVLTNLAVDKDAMKANALFFRATLEQVIITEVERGKLPAEMLNKLIKSRAESQKNKGRKTKEDANKSVALKLAELLGVF